jgi:hypothetical protein
MTPFFHQYLVIHFRSVGQRGNKSAGQIKTLFIVVVENFCHIHYQGCIEQ